MQVQQAAAIEPLEDCPLGQCPVSRNIDNEFKSKIKWMGFVKNAEIWNNDFCV